jgi:DNA replication protein DnaC
MDTSLAHDLTVLKLHYLAENFDLFVNSAQGENAEDILKKLVTLELVEKNRRSVERRLQEARLGRFKRMEHFDWNWPEGKATIPLALLKNIFAGDMVKSEKNLILMGPRGGVSAKQ